MPYTHEFLNKGTLNVEGFPCGTVVKNPPLREACARDVSSIPGSGRCPGVGNSNPLQNSCLENSTDRGTWRATVHGVTKSQTPLSTQACTFNSSREQYPAHTSCRAHLQDTCNFHIPNKISSVVTTTSHANDPAPSGQKPWSGSPGREPHRHLRGGGRVL